MTDPPPVRVSRSEWIVLATMTAAVMIARGLLGYLDLGASVWGDEALYLTLARSVADLTPVTTTHYPPLYSVLVSPGLLAEEWFPAVMTIGAAASGLVVPAAHLLARSLRMRSRLAVAALAGVLPAGWIFTQFLMSENLSTPLAVLATALAIRGRRREGLWLGLAVAGLYLTRYLLLPMAIVLAVTWVVRVRQEERRGPGLRGALAMAAGALVPVGLWVLAATSAGIAFSRALGAALPAKTLGRVAETGTVATALLWVGIYAMVVLLVTLPAWPAVVAGAGGFRAGAGPPAQRVYLAVVAVLTAGYVAVAAQHSLGALYNESGVLRGMGRYLVHLTPLLLVLGLMLVERVVSRPRRPRAAIGSAGVLLAAVAGWLMLFEGWLLDLPPGAFAKAASAGDVVAVRSGWFFLLLLAVAAMTGVVVAVGRGSRWPTVLAWVWVAAYAVAPATWVVQSEAASHLAPATGSQGGTVDRKLYGLLAGLPAERFVVVLDQGIRNGHPRWSPRFWGIEPERVELLRAPDDLALPDHTADTLRRTALDLGCDGTATACVLVRRDALDLEPLLVDDRWGQTLRFYPM